MVKILYVKFASVFKEILINFVTHLTTQKNTLRASIPLFLLIFFYNTSCSSFSEDNRRNSLTDGLWRGVIHMQEKETPFSFELTENGDSLQMRIYNAEETLAIKDIIRRGDSLYVPMHIFDTELQMVEESGSLKGTWIKHYAGDYNLPFTATREDSRYPEPEEDPSINMSGKWAVTFQKNLSPGDTRPAIGLFKQEGTRLTGTFLTPTGDYRYLEGVVNRNSFSISSFDGENAHLFEGTMDTDEQLQGTFWSGKSRKENWTAVRNEKATLPNADTLTYLKDGHDSLHFEFPDLEGKTVSLSDPKYRNKVVIVQIFGTWCPNCMDETLFLADWYRKNKTKEVEIIGLAYEQKEDFDYARKRVKRMADKLGAEYDFLIAGTSKKESASKSLPMLNHIMSFPTTIFIDKKGKVRKIHTGFSGPGTGEYYEKFKEDFDLLTQKLLAE